ncbi:MAG TPA: enoyl-CoA hydratase-related protein, partial [Gemmatimonadaceae bacterium]
MPDILWNDADGVATVTLNRPEVLNSFTRAMARDLCDALSQAASDDTIRAVVLTGAGRAFCAGQDLAEAAPRDREMPDLGDIVRDSYNPVIRAIRKLEKPVVCAVNGVAAGAGANLAFACDIVFASSTATFVQSFARIGVIPDSGGTFILPRIVGLHRATVMTMLAEKMSAEQARDWGLVYMVVEPSALLEAATGTARQLATQPTRALGLIK